MEKNEVIEKLPQHLFDLVIEQPYNEYSAQDHAVWRYVMRQNTRYLPQVAHGSYLEGLRMTGVSIESIPHMYGMNRILQKIGWAAVAVDGFIPPAAFMEFQAHKVLVIAADIRPIDQIGYTPAPDIIHEAAGHAPIIADPNYAIYLQRFGEIGSKALSSAKDFELYEAIRYLSILKANPYTPKEKIAGAEACLALTEKSMGAASEMSRIRNLHWWTVEYGLIGTLEQPRIYGAGLLSSISESFNCLQPHVKKLPYTIEAANYAFDITNQQPQLFVTPDFETLTAVLEKFADSMALRRGGLYAVETAINSKNTATCVYSSGLQVSGTFTNVWSKNNEPVYIKVTGAATLNVADKMLEGHGKDYHAHGFSSPVGRIKGVDKAPEYFSDADLKTLGLVQGKNTSFEFVSGVNVKGTLKNVHRENGKITLLSFTDCMVTYNGETLFAPDWGVYDMAVGEKIVSAYSGPADPIGFGLHFPDLRDKTIKIKHSDDSLRLHELYKQVRQIRETGNNYNQLSNIWQTLKTIYPNEWLLPMEILEMHNKTNGYVSENEIRQHLNTLSTQNTVMQKLINDGLMMVQ